MTPDQEAEILRSIRVMQEENQETIRSLKSSIFILFCINAALSISFIIPAIAIYIIPASLAFAFIWWLFPSESNPAFKRQKSKKHFLWGLTPPPKNQ
jgi:hypothetical protein